jgi:hypothetical protein
MKRAGVRRLGAMLTDRVAALREANITSGRAIATSWHAGAARARTSPPRRRSGGTHHARRPDGPVRRRSSPIASAGRRQAALAERIVVCDSSCIDTPLAIRWRRGRQSARGGARRIRPEHDPQSGRHFSAVRGRKRNAAEQTLLITGLARSGTSMPRAYCNPPAPGDHVY